MDLQALRYFRVVAKEGSFSQAAQKLNYAQSNLSTKIRQLEQEFQTPLFYRHAYGVRLTEKGETLLAYTDRLFQLVAEVENVMKDDGAARGSLRIGTMESASVTFMPELLAKYHHQYPDVSLSVQTGVSAESIRQVLDYDLDGALVAGAVNHAELSGCVVRREKLSLFSTAELDIGTPVAELLSQPLLVLPYGCSYRWILEQWLHEENIVPAKLMEFDSLGAILASVSAGLGVTLFPETLVSFYAAGKTLVSHEVPAAFAQAEISFVWRRDRVMDSTLQSFISLVRAKKRNRSYKGKA